MSDRILRNTESIPRFSLPLGKTRDKRLQAGPSGTNLGFPVKATPPAPIQSEGRGYFSARFAPPTTAGREVFCWCIGIQLLVLVLAFARSPASLATRASVAAASVELLVPIIELSPSNKDGPTETAGSPESAPTAAEQESLTALPEMVVAVAAEEIPMPDAGPAGLLDPLPAPEIPAPSVRENPRPIPVLTRRASRPASPAASAGTPRTPATSNPNAVSGASAPGTGGAAQMFSGGGTGRFPLPPYPTDAKRRGLEGRVMLRVGVGADGTPGVPVIESSSGHSTLDRAALDWIKRRWRWESGPPRIFRIPIIFKLQ